MSKLGSGLIIFVVATWPVLVGATGGDAVRNHQLAETSEQTFDGDWSARLDLKRGDCGGTYNFDFEIEGGEISGTIPGRLGSYQFRGRVEPGGQIVGLKATGSRDQVFFNGTFNGDSGTGEWNSKSLCKGTFRFVRD